MINPDDFQSHKPEMQSIDPELHDEFRRMLPKLLQLCHPDRHPDRQATAKEITQWLTVKRKLYRRAK